jgi:uncharacterized protein (TIGR02594 family)
MTKWMDVAKSHVGLKEYPGAGSNPLIMQWAKKLGKVLGIAYTDDSVPWCGLFAAHCMADAGITPVAIAVRASAWEKFGVALAKPSYGAVMVFTRAGGGHVSFYVSEDADTYHVLGGNQGDAVSVTKIAKNRCSAIRWPAGIALPTGGPIIKKFDGKISTNES